MAFKYIYDSLSNEYILTNSQTHKKRISQGFTDDGRLVAPVVFIDYDLDDVNVPNEDIYRGKMHYKIGKYKVNTYANNARILRLLYNYKYRVNPKLVKQVEAGKYGELMKLIIERGELEDNGILENIPQKKYEKYLFEYATDKNDICLIDMIHLHHPENLNHVLHYGKYHFVKKVLENIQFKMDAYQCCILISRKSKDFDDLLDSIMGKDLYDRAFEYGKRLYQRNRK